MTDPSIQKALALAGLAAMLAQPAICAAGDARSVQPADLVLFHGTILTVDGKDSIAEALAVRGGKIVAIGTTQEILRLAGSKTRRIDLNGRTATPGLIDSHAHIADGGVGELYSGSTTPAIRSCRLPSCGGSAIPTGEPSGRSGRSA